MRSKEKVKLSWFSGISIEMCFNDPSEPHFHAEAEYEGESAIFDLNGALLWGSLPFWGIEDVREWASRHAIGLQEAWDKRRRGETPSPISSLGDSDESAEAGKPLPKLAEVEARDGFRIWVRFDDGVSGEIDLSDHVGKEVFKAWDDPEFFKGVYVNQGRAIAWSEEIDLCPDAAYMDVAGLTVEEVFPEFFKAPAGA